MAGFGSLSPLDEVASMPADNPIAKIVAGGLKSVATLPQRAIQAASAPPGLRREDFTDIPGTAQPVDPLVAASTEAAMNMIGAASPFASAGAVGAAGGKLAKPSELAAPYHDILEPIKAYHGSPHDFDRFDLSKIGTGEGAQAYGHGIYLAENPEVARAYRDALELRKTGPGRPSYETPEYSARSVLDAVGGDPNRAIAEIEKRREDVRGLDPRFRAEGSEEKFQKVIDILKEGRPLGGGKMYEVNIHADPAHFLDWNSPFFKQSEKVQDALHGLGVPNNVNGGKRGSDIYRDIGISPDNKAGGAAYMPDFASDTMKGAGIPGIKYLDQGSRAAGNGSRNYVIFDDKLVKIARKYAVPGMVGAGGFGALALPPKDQ